MSTSSAIMRATASLSPLAIASSAARSTFSLGCIIVSLSVEPPRRSGGWLLVRHSRLCAEGEAWPYFRNRSNEADHALKTTVLDELSEVDTVSKRPTLRSNRAPGEAEHGVVLVDPTGQDDLRLLDLRSTSGTRHERPARANPAASPTRGRYAPLTSGQTRGNSAQSIGPPGSRSGISTWPVRSLLLNMFAGCGFQVTLSPV